VFRRGAAASVLLLTLSLSLPARTGCVIAPPGQQLQTELAKVSRCGGESFSLSMCISSGGSSASTSIPVAGLGGRSGREMNVAEAQSLLSELAALSTSALVEVGTSGRPPHNYAYLKLTSPFNPENHAVVSTRGDGWFELEVDGGFNTGITSDLTPDEDVRENLERYVHAATSYLAGHWSASRSRVFRVPFITVQTDDGPLKLGLSVRETLKHVFKS
jgi:hypothetical protein